MNAELSVRKAKDLPVGIKTLKKFITKKMKVIENLKARAENIRKGVTLIYYAYQNPGTKLLPKLIILFTLGYALSPIDLIPDFIPILGYLDDLIIIPALILLSIKLIPKDIIDESRVRSENEPLELKKNWIFAFTFILIWMTLFTFIILKIWISFER